MSSPLARTALLGAAIALAVAGIIAVAVGAGDESTTTASTSTTSPVASSTIPPPRSNQVRFSGFVDDATFDGVLGSTVAMPITIEVGAAGLGNGADITDVLVDGEPASVIWDGGRPLEISGTGQFSPDPTTFVIGLGTFAIELDNRFHGLTAGTYDIATPVAVGREGVAAPRDAVTIEVPTEAIIAARGAVSLELEEGSWQITGPGSVAMQGSFEIETSAGPATAKVLTLAEGGLYDLTVFVTEDGYLVEGTLQGDFEIDGEIFVLPDDEIPDGAVDEDPALTEDPTLG